MKMTYKERQELKELLNDVYAEYKYRNDLNEYIVITTLFIQIIVLFPEKVNYFFPCEIRTKKGFILF